MNTKIWATNDKSFDIGCKVVKWDEKEGFNFVPYGKYTWRNWDYDKLKEKITQFTVHWSVNYRAKSMYYGLKARGLSVNFMIDDDCNEDGFATIYQTLPIQHAGWSQGTANGISFNQFGSGVEFALMPQAWEKNMYSESNRKKFHVPEHETTIAPIHGTKLKVFLPTKAQMSSLINLIWGYCELFPNVKPYFPKDENGNYITTTIKNAQDYKGLLNHYNIKRGKIDTAGLDLNKIEETVYQIKELGF